MRRSGIAFGGVCAATAILWPCAVMAQDGGLQLTFGLENRLEVVGNDSLSVPATGTLVSNVTALSFGLTSETQIDRLDFSATGAAIVETGDGDTELDFGRAEVQFSYHREVPAAVLDLTAEMRSGGLDTFDALTGADEPGTQTDYVLDGRIETGRTSALGFGLGVGYSRTEYEDTVDPDLFDSTEARADAAVILRFSEIATGRLGVRYSEREEEDPGTTVTQTMTTFVGLDYSVNERVDLSAELGYAEIETEEFGVIDRTTGPDFRLAATYDMPVGTASALLRVSQDSDEGQRTTFEIGREFEGPRDTIAARLGVTRGDETGSDVVGSLSWDRTLPDGSIGIDLEREVGFDSEDDSEVDSSRISVNWLKNVSDVSSISLDITYEQSDSSVESVDQLTLGAGYSHRLTQDWSLDSGVGYRVRDDADGRARSPNLFVALSRDFQIRP